MAALCLPGGLARAPFVDLQNEHALGEAKVATLKAAFVADVTTFNGGSPSELHGRDAVMKECSDFFDPNGPTLSWTPTHGRCGDRNSTSSSFIGVVPSVTVPRMLRLRSPMIFVRGRLARRQSNTGVAMTMSPTQFGQRTANVSSSASFGAITYDPPSRKRTRQAASVIGASS